MVAPRKPAKKKSPKQMSTMYRDHARNARKAAPFGRYEDKSPMRGPKGKPNLPKRPRSK